MILRSANFKGMIPRLHPRLLPDGFAQVSINTRLESGSMAPYGGASLEHDFGAAVNSIYKHGSTWLSWITPVNVCPGPVAADRLYYTGDGAPKVRKADGTIYPLKLDAPAAAPTLVTGGTLNAALAEAITYAYTFVTELDEESAPSPLPATVQWSPGMTVTVSGFSAAPGGRGIDRRRIYRSQTSTLGVTDLYFVKELPLATASFVHDLATDPMAEVIPSMDFDPAPDDLSGLTIMPNGFFAAFIGKELLFSEPWIPHAWPEKYRLRTNYDIVGIASFGSTLAVMTTGTPYIVQGTAPDSMVMEQMESGKPCISAGSIVDLGYAAAYASHEGLITITASGTQNATEGLFDKRGWQALSPETLIAESIDGKYIFAHLAGQIDTLSGGAPNTDYSALPVYDTGGPASPASFVGYIGGNPATTGENRALGLIDLSGSQPFYVEVQQPPIQPTALYAEVTEGALYILDDNTVVRLFDDPSVAVPPMRWRAKRWELPHLESFGVVLVETEQNATDGVILTTRIYADGVQIHSTTQFNGPARLPAGFWAKRWEIEVEGTAEVTTISIAGNVEELAT